VRSYFKMAAMTSFHARLPLADFDRFICFFYLAISLLATRLPCFNKLEFSDKQQLLPAAR